MRTVTLLFAGIVLLSACTKKPSTPTPNPTPNPSPPTGKCMLTHMKTTSAAESAFDLNADDIAYFYDSIYVDSAYHSVNKVSYKYFYTNQSISSIREYKSGQVTLIVNLTYNGSAKPQTVTFRDANNTLIKTYEFQYNANGELSSRTSKNLHGSHTIYYHYTGGLLTKVDYHDVDGNYNFYSYTYTNDDNKLVIDNQSIRYMFNLEGDDEVQTLCDGLLDNRKLISSMTRGTEIHNFTYQLNGKGYPEKVICDGKVIMENQFNCN